MSKPDQAGSTPPVRPTGPRLRQLCDRFELAWKAGQSPRIEDYLGETEEDERPALVRQLVRLEVLHRRRRGDSPRPEEYQQRFPALDLEWLAREITRFPPLGPNHLSTPSGRETARHLERESPKAPKAILCCPHCHNSLPLLGESFGEFHCPECGSSFRVVDLGEMNTQDEIRWLGRFQLLQQVGKGSYGSVWRARDTELDRIVALKIPHQSLLTSAEYVERIQREARAAAQLRHPGIVRLYEVATPEGVPVLVSDFIEGIPLKELLEFRQMTFPEAASLVADVAEALDYAHAMGLVHRDIKPGNIMVEFGRPASTVAGASGPPRDPREKSGTVGRPVLVDFGLALREEAEIVMTVEGQIIGTPAYMSPEQASGQGHQADRRSDVYGLGVVLYQLLCGELPFRGSKTMLLHQVIHEEPRPPRRINDQIPRDLETICLKAMAKEPGKRYATARELARDLRRFQAGEPIHARPAGKGERLWRWCRRNPTVASLIAAVACSLVAGTVTASYFAVQATLGKREAVEKAEQLLHEKLLSDRRRYGAEINLGYQAWKNGQIALVQEKLREQEPLNPAPDLRGFEWYYLHRLCQRDLYTLRGHDKSVRCLAVSPDGRWLASGGDDLTVRVWDMATGKEVRILRGHTQPIWGLAVSPDGRRLASSSRAYDGKGSLPGEVKVWDLSQGTPIWTLPGHRTPVLSVAFSADSRRLACACGGQEPTGAALPGEVKVWDLATGKEAFCLRDQKRPVMSVAFSPDDRWLASAGADLAVKVWDAQGGTAVATFSGHGAAVVGLAFSPDSQRLASASHDETIRVWDLIARKEAALTLQTHRGPVQSVAFSPDGIRIASAGRDQTVKVWDAKTGLETLTLRGHAGAVYNVLFSPDGWRLASAGEDQTIRIWDVSGERSALSLTGHTDGVLDVAFSPDGRHLAAAGEDRTVKLWDALLGHLSRSLYGHSDAVLTLAFSRDGRHLASAGKDHTIKIWNAATGDQVHTLLGHKGNVQGVAFSPDGRLVASGSEDRTVRLWDATSGKELHILQGHTDQVYSVAFGPAVVGTAGYGLLASAGGDRQVRVWDPTTGKHLFTLQGHAGAVRDVAFSPTGGLLASSSEDRTVRFWSLTSQAEAPRTLRGHPGTVHGLAFSPDGQRLASAAGTDRTVKIWDTVTGQELGTLAGHEAAVVCVGFSPNGWQLASGSYDGSVRVWDASPLTAEVQERRQATALAEFLVTKSPTLAHGRNRLQADHTITDSVRERAQGLLEPHYRHLLRRDADRLIGSLSLIPNFSLKQDLLERIRSDASLGEPLRLAALTLAEHYVERPRTLDRQGRAIARQPGKTDVEYRLALRWAEVACRLSPQNGPYRTTLGMAQYRTGQYREAVDTLTEAAQLNAVSPEAPLPADLAFLAMALHGLGERAEAQAMLQRLRRTMAKPQWAWQEEAQRFLDEAERLVKGQDK